MCWSAPWAIRTRCLRVPSSSLGQPHPRPERARGGPARPVPAPRLRLERRPRGARPQARPQRRAGARGARLARAISTSFTPRTSRPTAPCRGRSSAARDGRERLRRPPDARAADADLGNRAELRAWSPGRSTADSMGARRSATSVYLSRHGCLLAEEGSEIALAAVEAHGRRFRERSESQVLEHVELGPPASRRLSSLQSTTLPWRRPGPRRLERRGAADPG